MTKKTPPKRYSNPQPDAAAQYQRFLDAAKEVGASDDPKALEKAVKKVAPTKKQGQ